MILDAMSWQMWLRRIGSTYSPTAVGLIINNVRIGLEPTYKIAAVVVGYPVGLNHMICDGIFPDIVRRTLSPDIEGLSW